LNPRRKSLIRRAIEMRCIPCEMKKWWSTLKNLIWERYDARKGTGWNTGNESPDLLHAALWNSDLISPIVIELILELRPHFHIYEKQPGTYFSPIHVAAEVPSYIPLPFERNLSMGAALEMITLLDVDALISRTNKGRLPLHMAIASGKGWTDLKRMINIVPATLSIRDPLTGLFPFQMVACGSAVVSNHRTIRAKMAYTQLNNNSPKENSRLLRSFSNAYELDKLNSVYSFLRVKPSLICRI
jgi:hypothetical protein